MSLDVQFGEHQEVLGSEFCSGFTDSTGNWNSGFYCPGDRTQAQYCCGIPTDKYCCSRREHVPRDDLSRLPLVLGVALGVVAALAIVTLASCCFCSCCVLYKKRQPRLHGGALYRMHCSSTASGVANMYSFSNQNSLVSTPLDMAVASSRLLVDLEHHTMTRGHTFSRLSDSNELIEEPPTYHGPPVCFISEKSSKQSSPPAILNSEASSHRPSASTVLMKCNSSPVTAVFSPPEKDRAIESSRTCANQHDSSSSTVPPNHHVLYHSTKF